MLLASREFSHTTQIVCVGCFYFLYLNFIKRHMYIVHQLTGEKTKCEILKVEKKDFIFIKKNFSFDWSLESHKHEVYKLKVLNNNFIHGLISVSSEEEYLLLWLVELHEKNIGKSKEFDRIAGNLIAFAAVKALREFDGYMKLVSKSELIEHYKVKYGFMRIGSSNQMISYPSNTKNLVHLYYEKN